MGTRRGPSSRSTLSTRADRCSCLAGTAREPAPRQFRAPPGRWGPPLAGRQRAQRRARREPTRQRLQRLRGRAGSAVALSLGTRSGHQSTVTAIGVEEPRSIRLATAGEALRSVSDAHLCAGADSLGIRGQPRSAQREDALSRPCMARAVPRVCPAPRSQQGMAERAIACVGKALVQRWRRRTTPRSPKRSSIRRPRKEERDSPRHG
jgi:hypothetical protein